VKRCIAPNEFATDDNSFYSRDLGDRPTNLDANLERESRTYDCPRITTVFSQLRLYADTTVDVEQYPPTTFAKTTLAVRASGAALLFHLAI